MSGFTSARPRTGRGFVAAAVALLVVAGLSAAAVSAYATASAHAGHTMEVRQQLTDWAGALIDAETGVRGYLASDDLQFLEPYRLAVPRARKQAEAVRHLVAEEPAQVRAFEGVERDARLAMQQLEAIVALAQSRRRDDALALLASGENKRRMDVFRAAASEMRDAEARALLERQAVARAWATLALLGSIVVTLLSCTLLVVGWRRERAQDARLTALADEARARLRALSEVAAALAGVRSRAQVAAVVVEQVMRAAGADTCTLYELDDSGAALELVADRGVAPEVLAKIRRITETEGNAGVMLNMKAGISLWAESDAEYAGFYPSLAATEAERPRARAFWSVPLVAEGRSLGLLGVGYYRPRRFSADERLFVETLSHHCAQAMLRASRLEREEEARQWLATTLRSIGDGVIATDATGRVTFMNQIAETLTGWAEADARGRPLEEVFCIYSEQTHAIAESPVTKVLREGKIVGLANHTVLRSKQGVEIPIDDSGAPIRAEGGRITGVVLVFRDGTEEKRARVQREFLARAGEALVASIDYAAILTTVARFAVPTLADWCSIDLIEPGATAPRQVAVAHVDEDKVRLARELGERYPPDPNAPTGVPQVIRTGKSELYPEIPREMLVRAARDAAHARMIDDLRLESAMVVPLRVRGRTFGAITFVFADSGRRYTPDDLSFAEDFARRAAMAIENAVALKQAEEGQVREHALRAQAELANRAKDEFLATVSHELRTPLTSISGWATLLRRRAPPAELDRGLAIIERNARLQTKLIEDVLDISRIISGKLALTIGPTKLQDVVSAAVETVTPAANLKGIVITSRLPNDPLAISADPDRLQQVLWNLLTNAVKFTPKGGRVAVTAGRDGSDLWIRVEDNGEGIRGPLLPILFEPFRQADASTTRRHGGLGLGLAIVRELVLAHGGTVSADSAGEGQGSTFLVRLPARAVVPVMSREGLGALADTSTSAIGEDVSRLDGLRVLVVDDEQDALDLLVEVLSEQGAVVHAASSARQALRDLAAVRPHVLVSDIGMPGMDGVALIQTIRTLPPEQGGQTPAVALTAFTRSEDAQRALAAGYHVHVGKPVELPELTKAIATVARGPDTSS
jgi:PAS domain S-box-containing protein